MANNVLSTIDTPCGSIISLQPQTSLTYYSDHGSRLIKASQKISSHNISERFNFDGSYYGDQEEKRSNTLSKRRCEINKVLHKSDQLYRTLPELKAYLTSKLPTLHLPRIYEYLC